MREKLKRTPLWVILAAVLGVLALTGFAIYKTAQNYADGSFHMPDMTPEEWARHRAEMMRLHGGGDVYRTAGAPDGGRRPGAANPSGPRPNFR